MLKKGKPFIWVPEKDMHNVVWFLFVQFFCYVCSSECVYCEKLAMISMLLCFCVCVYSSSKSDEKLSSDFPHNFGSLPPFFFMQNTIIDERGSFAVASPTPGPLAKLLHSIKKVGDYQSCITFFVQLCHILLYPHKIFIPLLLHHLNPPEEPSSHAAKQHLALFSFTHAAATNSGCSKWRYCAS